MAIQSLFIPMCVVVIYIDNFSPSMTKSTKKKKENGGAKLKGRAGSQQVVQLDANYGTLVLFSLPISIRRRERSKRERERKKRCRGTGRSESVSGRGLLETFLSRCMCVCVCMYVDVCVWMQLVAFSVRFV